MSPHRVRVASFGDVKIMAIKLARQLSGVGLREAKELVEAGAWFELGGVDEDRVRSFLDDAASSGIQLEFDPPLGQGPGSGSRGSTNEDVSSGSCAVRYLSGSRKIHAIKLAREISGQLGLKEAKDLVERQGVFASGLSLAQAQAIAARFEEIGSQVQIETNAGPPSAPSESTSASRPPDYGGPADGSDDGWNDEDFDF